MLKHTGAQVRADMIRLAEFQIGEAEKMAQAKAKAKSGNLSKASEKLRVRQSEILTRLASKYTRELAAEFISVTDAIEVVDEMIRKEAAGKPAADVNIGMPVSTG
jgi:2-oxoglutarate dehydrogenase complex dehydrogenase (E1) component-like enzyme